MSDPLHEKYKNLRVKLTDHYARHLSETVHDQNMLVQVQRSMETTLDDFMFEVGHYLRILKPRYVPGQRLLHVAAGNGLYNLILRAFYDAIVNVDPVEEMLDHCRHICRNLQNQTYLCAYGDQIPEHYPAESFDDVFFIGVANIVKDPQDYLDILDAVSKVIKRPGKLVIGRIPDLSKRDAYLSMLPGILTTKGFSEERIEQIVEDNRAVAWYSMGEIVAFVTARGAKSCVPHNVSVQHIGHQCMTDMLITF